MKYKMSKEGERRREWHSWEEMENEQQIANIAVIQVRERKGKGRGRGKEEEKAKERQREGGKVTEKEKSGERIIDEK